MALVPLVSGVLIGAAWPAYAAPADDSAPPPRLRLALALESVTSAPVASAGGLARDTDVAHDSTTPETVSTPLRLATSLQASLPPARPASPGEPADAPARRLPPQPAGRRGDPAAPTPRPGSRADNSRDGRQTGPSSPASPATTGSNSARDGSPAPAAPASGDGAIAAAVEGDGEFLPADELDPPLPTTRPQPGTLGGSGFGTPSPPKRNWGIAPVRWGGSLGAGFRRRSADESDASSEQVYEARLRASSFIMQPYIALVSGDFGLTMVRSQSDDAANSNLTGTSINGSGTLNVFPQSRFPFQASLALSDSRSDGSLASSNTERRRLALQQDYRPIVGTWRASGQYDRSELTGDFGVDTVDRVGASFSGTLGEHSVTTNGSFSRNESREQTTDDLFVLGSHGVRLSDAMTVDTSATFTRQEFELGESDFQFDGNTQSAQVFSYLSWTPADSPWRGTVNARYFQTDSQSGDTAYDSRNFGGAASLSYVASRNLNLFGSVGANSSSNGELSSSQNFGLNYSADPVTFGRNNVYNWFGSTSLSNSTSSEGEAVRAANASVGHSLSRSWQPSAYSFLNGSLNQSIGSSRSAGLGAVSSNTLSHGASLSLQANAGDRLSGFLSTSVSDSRVTGDSPSTFQMLNIQLSGRWRIDAYAELNSNLTWQLSRQESSTLNEFLLIDEFGNPVFIDTTDQSRNSSISGNIGYSHNRAFGLRGMRYSADFRANTARDNARRRGDPDAEREPDRATLDLDQRLRYSIGRLDTELQLRVAEIEGRRSELLFFRVNRHFGAY
ncbi:hypothetical protein [Aromatoleum sp.]|uniref:hypothetical protein n=1 Tax=Aromatoleum sp. TaxID=2307007 RepID=UPI002FC7CB5F